MTSNTIIVMINFRKEFDVCHNNMLWKKANYWGNKIYEIFRCKEDF